MLIAATLAALLAGAPSGSPPAVTWEPWRDDVFAQAARDHKLVVLDLEAVWCHWCHVMASTTYQDPGVETLLRDHFIAVRVDQDANPELANRYGEWGWPATILFTSDGAEVVKHRGYLDPGEMRTLLAQVVANPRGQGSSRGDDAGKPGSGALGAPRSAELWRSLTAAYDPVHGGFGNFHRYLDAEVLELLLRRGAAGDCASEHMAQLSLDGARRLIDPVWGGMYQYSDKLDWSSPHFEKIASVQSDALETYALAFALRHRPEDRASAESIATYVQQRFMGDGGAFFTSQDADVRAPDETEAVRVDGHQFYSMDATARAAGPQPAIDRHSYAGDDGRMVSALARASGWLGEDQLLTVARAGARFLLEQRADPAGGFRHGEGRERPCLGDTLYAGRAFLDLYTVTGERGWLDLSRRAAQFASTTFASSPVGFATCVEPAGSPLAPVIDVEENSAQARWMNALYHATGEAQFQRAAQSAMAWLTSTQALAHRGSAAPILLANEECSTDPLHVTVIGSRDDPKARELWSAAIAAGTSYALLEWWDRSEGPPPHDSIPYPTLSRAAAFLCTARACSLPAFDPQRLTASIQRALSPPHGPCPP